MGCARGPGTEASTTSWLSLRLADHGAPLNLERRPRSRKLAIVSRRDAVGFYHPLTARPASRSEKTGSPELGPAAISLFFLLSASLFRGMPANPLGPSNKEVRQLSF